MVRMAFGLVQKVVPFCLGGLTLACSVRVGDHNDDYMPPEPSGVGGMPGDDFGTAGFGAMPTDTRPAVLATRPPPPISGGTLLVTRDGKTAVVADPDRDRISLVDLKSLTVAKTFSLDAGEQPGRIVEGENGRAYVLLRGAGSILTVDLDQQTLVARRAVCVTPRGIALNDQTSQLIVACADGTLVELPSDAETPRRTARIDVDLRDVVTREGRIFVTRFRSAEVLELDPEFNVVKRVRPPARDGMIGAFGSVSAIFEPSVAWRTIATDSGIFVTHQRATTNVITVDPGVSGPSGFPGQGAYGGGKPCTGVVQSAYTQIPYDGALETTPAVADVVLPVDIAIAPDGRSIALASAGEIDFESAFGNGVAGSSGDGPAVTVVDSGAVTEPSDCAFPKADLGSIPATAVAFEPSGKLLSFTREPARLYVTTLGLTGGHSDQKFLALGGSSVLDTGHELFHRNVGAGIACASCHPEGEDDGHVWNFSDAGERRTQYLAFGLEGTAPFHWSGDIPDFSNLMTRIFSGRMGGAQQSPERVSAMERWLFALEAPPPMRAADDPAALRGKILFDSREVACTQCHVGPKLTSKDSQDVGTGAELQVPSLIGVAYRPPFMHTGCAQTLFDRFDPACGGEDHGNTSQLSKAQIDDLIAYLESL